MSAFSGPIPPGLAALAGGARPGGAVPVVGAGGPAGPAGPGGPGIGSPLPPSLRSGAPGVGPMVVPQGNPGNALAAFSKVKTAISLLQESLPALPLGSAVHSDILKAVGMLAKHADTHDINDQSQITQLQALIQKLAQQQPNAALARMAQQNPNAPPATLPTPIAPPAPPGGPGVPTVA
jgi:hypothetical protein